MARAVDLLTNPEAEEYVEALHAMFGVNFDDETVDRWRTAGDVARAIEQAAAPSDTRGPPPAVKAFYMLRRAVGDRSIKPSTPLETIDGTRRATDFLVKLHRRTKLIMPGAPVGPMGQAAMAVMLQMFATLIIMWCASRGGWAVAAVLLGGLGLALLFGYLDGRAFRNDLKTFGDLARATAQLNLAVLWRNGAARRRDDVWPALRAWFASMTDVPEREIERESPLQV